MALVLLVLLALIPLLGVAWIAAYGSLFPQPTIDALFTSLILLSTSAIFGMTALFEVRRYLSGASGGGGGVATPSSLSRSVRRGRVKEVTFYEADVGQPNKSIVTLSDDGRSAEMLVLSGDVRNALPVGQKVQITLRKQGGENVLVDVQYS
ncbi:MAG TPA: hypothetical protein VEK33_04715 [Terriglobales bacterium]|nr:hypothetical protein [Terriglobales bacterium]